MTQQLEESQFDVAAEALEQLRLYDETKTQSDPDLQKISGYYHFPEREVCEAVQRVTERLHDPEDISFSDYGRLAVGLIEINHRLKIDVSDAKDLLILNLKGRGKELSQEKIFGYFISDREPEMAKEFATLRAMMVESLNYAGTPLSDFDYQPENASQFYHLITDNTTQYCEQRCFAKHLNISKLVDMFIASSPAQMNDIRRAFTNLYGDNGTAKNLYDDVGSISELLLCLKERTGAAITESKLDKVQILQYDWLVECLGKWLTMIQNIETV